MLGLDYKQYITIGEHIIKQPDLPKDKSQVLFLEEKDAYWRREILVERYKEIWNSFIPFHTKIYQQATIYDQDEILISLNKEDSDYIVRMYEEEIRRRREGVFMKNNNEIIWVPGDYWFVLMHCKTKRPDKKSDYFDFREYQKEDAILCKYVENDPLILGLGTSKAKKTGITNLRWLYCLNKATMSKNINMSNMNLSLDQGAKTFRDYFMYAYNNLPSAFKPQVKTKSEADGKITFGKQYRNTKKATLLKNDSSDDLNTTVMCVPALPHACDVDVFDLIWFDELVKTKGDCEELYRSNSSGTSIQDDIIGKIWITNYTPEENSPAFTFCKQLFYDSELRTLNEKTKQTKSKLIWHHIPAYQSWSTSFNKYGRCDEQDAMRKIQNKRDALKDRPRELQGEIRKYANTKKEAWSTGGVGSVFDNILLSDLLSDVEEEQRNSIETPYVEGRLIWDKPLWEIGVRKMRRPGEFTNVKFVPLTDEEKQRGETGRLRMYYQIHRDDQNIALKQGRDQWNNLLPPPRFRHIGAGDPTNYAAASEVIEGSLNASYTMNIPDEIVDSRFGKILTKIMVSEYFDRPESPEEAYEDYLKEIIYFGKLVIIEGNVPYVGTRLLAEGLGHYCMVRDENGIIKPWKRYMGLSHEPDKKYKLIRTTANSDTREMMETFVRLIKNYIERPPDGYKDYGRTIKSERLLTQLMDIDITDTKKFDLFMAFGYCLLCLETYMDSLLEPSYGTGDDEISAVLKALCG